MRTMIVVAVLAVVLAVAAFSGAGLPQGNNQSPSDKAIGFAQRASDLLLATLLAALTQEFNETTPQNVEEGKVSIGLVFSDSHTNFRLVGTNGPLSENDRPQDDFERRA